MPQTVDQPELDNIPRWTPEPKYWGPFPKGFSK